MPKVVIVSGTRPEVVKLAPVLQALRNIPTLTAEWHSTGQHREMLDQAEAVFGITPDVDFDVMQPNQTPLDVVTRISKELEQHWSKDKPDFVVVQGDTATTFAAALTAFYMRIPVGHVEAGLRSYNPQEPFPEEAHRRMIGPLTTLHFPPTAMSQRNLLIEHFTPEDIYTVGNTVVDALLSIPDDPDFVVGDNVDPNKRLILVTAHRRENHQQLTDICKALKQIRDANDDVEIVFPVHLNPNVRKVTDAELKDEERIHLLDPMGYFDFVQLMRRAQLIMTDSGGIQEEAPTYKIPTLVLRRQTERPEAVNAGMARLVGTDTKTIVDNANDLLQNADSYEAMRKGENPFGDGLSGQRIAEIINDFLAKG